MTPEEHQQEHIQLHHALDVLLACYLEENMGPPGSFRLDEGLASVQNPILDLLQWAHQKTMIPSAYDRDQRQLILLALACLALDRPGAEPAIKDVARYYDTEGLPAYEELKRSNELAVKGSRSRT
jgi:hypothetical protein